MRLKQRHPVTDATRTDGSRPAGAAAPETRTRRRSLSSSALLETVTEDDMRAVAAKLVEMARGGDLPAIREMLERTLGKPVEADFMERLDELEKHLTQERTR